jgi:hypothetical protein
MQLLAFVRVSHYQDFLTKESLQDTRESFQRFLSEVGTGSIRFNIDESADYKKVPPGSCVRLRNAVSKEEKADSQIIAPVTSDSSSCCYIN